MQTLLRLSPAEDSYVASAKRSPVKNNGTGYGEGLLNGCRRRWEKSSAFSTSPVPQVGKELCWNVYRKPSYRAMAYPDIEIK